MNDEQFKEGVLGDSYHAALGIAFGYALGVMDAQPPNVSYGVNGIDEIHAFANAYANTPSDRRPDVRSAFGEWRTTGNINFDD